MGLDLAKVKAMAVAYAEAWCSKSPQAVASFFAPDGSISINRGEPSTGQAALVEMAAGFYAAVPDISVYCDDVRVAGDHALLLWTFDGHHAETNAFVTVSGWEEWDLGEDLKIKISLGWFDAEDYARQIATGGQSSTS